MIDINRFRNLIVRPSLKAVDLWSEDDEELLILTCAQESLGCTYLRQIKGPALGPYCCEPTTYESYWKDYLYKNSYYHVLEHGVALENTILYKILKFINQEKVLSDGKYYNPFSLIEKPYYIPDINLLMENFLYASIMCRVHYLRVSEPIPSRSNIQLLAEYYKKHYNTDKGKATVEEAIKNYYAFIGGSHESNSQ